MNVKHQPAAPLLYSTVQAAYFSAQSSHPEEVAGRMDGAAALEQELDRRSNAYPQLVEAIKDCIDEVVSLKGGEARALLRELGEIK